jgi:hypothetical protein
VQKLAHAAGHTTLAAHAGHAITHEESVAGLQLEWARVRDAPSEPSTLPLLDQEVDRCLGNLFNVATAMAGVTAPNMPTAAAKAILAKVFPGGLRALTQRTFEEECKAVAVIVKELNGALAAHVTALGVGPVVAELAAANARYEAALGVVAAPVLTFDKVRAAQVKGQDLLLETVARILGLHPSASEADTNARAALLAPILAQEADLKAARARRRSPGDVNPTTGEPVAESNVLPVVTPGD